MADKHPLSNKTQNRGSHKPEGNQLRKGNLDKASLSKKRGNYSPDHLIQQIAITTHDFLFILDPQKKLVRPILPHHTRLAEKRLPPISKRVEKEFLNLMVKEDQVKLWNAFKNFNTQNGVKSFGETEVKLLVEENKSLFFNIRYTPHTFNEKEEVLEWFCQAKDITDSKEKRFDAQNNELKDIQLALDNVGLGIWLYDFKEKKIKLDNRTCEILGLNPLEINGDLRAVISRVHPDERNYAITTAFNIFRKKERVNHELRFIHPHSAVVKQVAIIGDPITNEQEGVSKITGVCLDISRHKLVENKFETNEAFLEESQRIAKLGSFYWDLELDKVHLTREMYSILDMQPGTLFNLEGFYEKVHPQDRNEVKITLRNSIKKGGVFSKEFRLITSGGESRNLWAQGQISMNNKMRTTRVLGTIQDVTEKKEKEKEFHTQNLIIRSILYNLPVIIRIIEKNGTILSLLGEAGLRRIGMEENQIVGENIFTKDPTTGNKIKKVLTGETVNFTEKVLYNGRELTFLSYYFYDPERELAIGFSIDITAQKQTEAAFQQVYAKNRELERMNQVMDMFVYATAHDLKNPINNLEMLSLLLKEAHSPQEQNEYMEALMKSVQRLKQTISGLTEIVQVESQRGISSTELKFKKVFTHVMADLEPHLKEKNGTIKTKFEKETIYYNEAFLTSILKNLISNSIKYSDTLKPLHIKVKTEIKNEYVVLSVTDNGIGIDLQQIQPNLFKPFKRFTSQAGGSGIGLHLIKSMVEKNGGYIEVESTPGKGTSFYCYLVPFSNEEEK